MSAEINRNAILTYKILLIILAILIAVFNRVGLFFTIPLYALLSFSYWKANNNEKDKAKLNWVIIPLALAILLIILVPFII